MKKITVLLLLCLLHIHMFAKDETLHLQNNRVSISWVKTNAGWTIRELQLRVNNRWQTIAHPSGAYTLLYAAEKPSTTPDTVFFTITGKPWPDTVYKYQINVWKQATSPVALNRAGTAINFYPANAQSVGRNKIVFTHETELATVTAEWTLDEQFAGDIRVTQQLVTKKPGYYSLASPTIAVVNENELQWATVPGYFQGNEIQPNFILSYAYGQGIPALPVLYRERCASTLCPIITSKDSISVSVMPDPSLGRDPWAKDKYSHQDWFVAVSHKNRQSQLTPTLYYPVLGEPKSQLATGEKINYSFRYSLLKGPWYKALTHAVNDVWEFNKTLALRTNRQSLTNRVERMQAYLSDRTTSLWNIEDFNGKKIGGQSYLGGVVGSNHDAIKNSDYGAMWMLANTSHDRFLKDSVLPYALNFKLAQQQTADGFFQGAAIGQYYLARSKRFTEEWGEFVEPVGLTYYIMLDIGNILLFEPANDSLRQRLALGAKLLLQWQKPDGSWEVGYDKFTNQPLFTDIKDLRPTFYGLMVAYRILKDPKYLAAARKGADWFITNAVEKGNFIGVCGDARYAPDFATGQSAQALLDLYDMTGDKKYETAAIATARMYLSSIYTQPVPSTNIKTVNGVQRHDWEIAQAGLSFEHGGIIGSANGAGPIMLCSHAGLFVRMFQLTKDSLFIEMARAAAIGRDAFVDSKTSVASYYWNAMNKGAGPYPHHAWWQIGWITDYLMAEAQMRSGGKIVFPRGFVTPKVGPHESYGFSPGSIYGEKAGLLIREGLITCDNPNVEHILAQSTDRKKLFVILLNDKESAAGVTIQINLQRLPEQGITSIRKITQIPGGGTNASGNSLKVSLPGYGMQVYTIE